MSLIFEGCKQTGSKLVCNMIQYPCESAGWLPRWRRRGRGRGESREMKCLPSPLRVALFLPVPLGTLILVAELASHLLLGLNLSLATILIVIFVATRWRPHLHSKSQSLSVLHAPRTTLTTPQKESGGALGAKPPHVANTIHAKPNLVIPALTNPRLNTRHKTVSRPRRIYCRIQSSRHQDIGFA